MCVCYCVWAHMNSWRKRSGDGFKCEWECRCALQSSLRTRWCAHSRPDSRIHIPGWRRTKPHRFASRCHLRRWPTDHRSHRCMFPAHCTANRSCRRSIVEPPMDRRFWYTGRSRLFVCPPIAVLVTAPGSLQCHKEVIAVSDVSTRTYKGVCLPSDIRP